MEALADALIRAMESGNWQEVNRLIDRMEAENRLDIYPVRW